MAFDIIAARGFGTQSDGDATNPATVNHYASVTATAAQSITISGSDVASFTAGTEILLHIAGVRNSSASAANLGKYKFAKVMSVDGNVLTLSVAPLNVSTTNYFYQAVTVPNYKTLTVSTAIAPPAFDSSAGYGGVLVLKANRINLTGSINLVDKGLTEETQRPLLNQETNGILDTDQLSGHENYETVNHLTLQKGDGACLIITKRIDLSSSARIGSPTLKGIARCRGANDSLDKPTEPTNIGGASILLVAETISNFTVAALSKYRSKTLEAGKGLGRCYIATESQLPNDEGLYAYDIISKPERLQAQTLISGFGNGSLGEAAQTAKRQNKYARVTSITNGGKTFALADITSDGLVSFVRDSLVMIHASMKDSNNLTHVGRFIVSKVVGITNDTTGKLQSITLQGSIDDLGLTNFDVAHYNFQALTIPQYSSFTGGNSLTPSYKNGRGGIFAIAVNGVCDLRDRKIDVEGTGNADLKYSLTYTSNNRMKNRLPIGQGHGSVFILAKTLKVNSATRIGSTSSGNAFGGAAGRSTDGSDGGFMGKRYLVASHESLDKYQGYGGSGLRGGQQYFGHNGGFCSNASDGDSHDGGLQGASIFIVAESIDGLCLDCLCTGGQGGHFVQVKSSEQKIVADDLKGSAGGCGYGGGGASYQNFLGAQGGVHGGGSGGSDIKGYPYTNGGGSSGFCTVYACNFTNQSTTNLIFD